jgi:hypothetical protein
VKPADQADGAKEEEKLVEKVVKVEKKLEKVKVNI